MTWSLYSLYIWVLGWVNSLLAGIKADLAALLQSWGFWQGVIVGLRLRIYNIEQQLTNITMPSFPSFQQIFSNVLVLLGVYVYPGETAFHAVVRSILNAFNIPCKFDTPVNVALTYWLDNKIGVVAASIIPAVDTVIGWVAGGLGIYRLPGETWWDAFQRRIREITSPWIQAFIPSFDIIADQVLSRFGIYRRPGETRLDAIWRTFWEMHPGTWQLVNWWSAYKGDVMAYFNDPQAWLWVRLERMFERFW